MTYAPPKLQWAMDVTVWHGPDFGHKVALTAQRQGQAPEQVKQWAWKGLGMPTNMIQDIQTWVAAVVADHLVYRYGIQDRFDFRPDGEPSPF